MAPLLEVHADSCILARHNNGDMKKYRESRSSWNDFMLHQQIWSQLETSDFWVAHVDSLRHWLHAMVKIYWFICKTLKQFFVFESDAIHSLTEWLSQYAHTGLQCLGSKRWLVRTINTSIGNSQYQKGNTVRTLKRSKITCNIQRTVHFLVLCSVKRNLWMACMISCVNPAPEQTSRQIAQSTTAQPNQSCLASLSFHQTLTRFKVAPSGVLNLHYAEFGSVGWVEMFL